MTGPETVVTRARTRPNYYKTNELALLVGQESKHLIAEVPKMLDGPNLWFDKTLGGLSALPDFAVLELIGKRLSKR